VNLDELDYKTEWEDPFFVGKSCLWHKHIVGTQGYICPDVLDGKPAIFVEYKDKTFTVPLSQLDKWALKIGAQLK